MFTFTWKKFIEELLVLMYEKMKWFHVKSKKKKRKEKIKRNKEHAEWNKADRIIIDVWITLQMAFWASQLISRLFQGTSMLAHYCNNWKPAAEACLSDYPGSRLHTTAKTEKNTASGCLLVWQVQGAIFLTSKKCLKEVTTVITTSHFMRKGS